MKKSRYLITFLAPLVLFSAYSCTRTAKKAGYSGSDPVAVTSYTVKPENVIYYDPYPATVEALNEVQLRSEVNGYVTGIYFKEGSHVAKGQTLYEIDRSKYEAAFEAARASLGIAQANLVKAERDAERYRNLDSQNAIAKQTLDDAMTALENAKMQVALAEANRKTAETDFNYSLITAPFAGVTGFSNVKPGAFITAGQTLLTTISSDNPIGVDFEIDQKSLPYFVRLGQSAVKADSVFRVILPDNSLYNHYGRLDVIDRAVDPGTGTIRIRVVFPNHEESLKPGMTCKINVLDENSGSHLVIPASATTEQMSENMVFVIESNKAVQKKVRLGPLLGNRVVILDGLKPGDIIVSQGIQNLRQGTEVTVDNSMQKQAEGKSDNNKKI